MALIRFEWDIIGESPILMNNPGGMRGGSEEKAAGKKKIPTPEQEAKGLLYIQPNGDIFGPMAGFRSAVVSAGKQTKFAKVSAVAVLKCSVFCPIDCERAILFDPKTKKPLTDKDYVIDTRRCVLNNGGKKVGVVRSRPRFNRWACVAALDIDTEFVEVESVDSMMVKAGKKVGYLDFRAECGGPFGRFSAKMRI